MNVQKTRIIAAAVIAAAVASVLFIVTPRTALTVAAYIFLLADTAIAAAMLWQIADGGLSRYLANAAMALALKSWLALSAILCIALPVLEATGLFSMSVKWFCAIQCLPFSAMGLTALAIGASGDEIERVGKSRKGATGNWKAFRVDIESIAANAPSEIRGEVEAVRDAMRYASPMMSLGDIELDIGHDVIELYTLVNKSRFDEARKLCAEIMAKVKERSIRQKLSR